MKAHFLLFGFATWMVLAAGISAFFDAWPSVGLFILSGVMLAWAGIDSAMETMFDESFDEVDQ